MNNLCKDIWIEILEYLNIEDYTVLRLTNSYFKVLIDHYTCFLDFVKLVKENKVFDNKILFYKCCLENKFVLAKFIYDNFNLHLFLIKDYQEFVFKSFDTIRNILAIQGIDVSRYKSLEDKNFSNVINFFESFPKNKMTIEYLDNKLFKYCKKRNVNLEKIELLCLFGDIKELDIRYAIKLCYDSEKYDVVKYLLTFSKHRQKSIIAYFIRSCRTMNIDKIKIFIENLKIKRKILIKGFIESLQENNLSVADYLFTIIHFNEHEYSKISYFYSYFCYSCRTKSVDEIKIFIENLKLKKDYLIQGFLESLLADNFPVVEYLLQMIKLEDHEKIKPTDLDKMEYMKSMLEKMNKKDIIKVFILACDNRNKQIYEFLISRNILDTNLLNTALLKNRLLKCLLDNIDIIEQIISNYSICEKTLIGIFQQACFGEKYKVVKLLLKQLNITDIIDSLIIKCCDLGKYGIVKFLIKKHKISISVRKTCFVKCLENERFNMLRCFARVYDTRFINYTRKNISMQMLNGIFKSACLENSIIGVKWLSKTTKIKDELLDEVVTECFKRGHLETCIFMVSSYKISSQILKKCFLLSCENGCLELIMLILSSISIDYNTINDGFVLCCQYDHIDVARYLHKNYNIDIFHNNEEALYKSHLKGNIDIATWLNDLASHKVNYLSENGTIHVERKIQHRIFNFSL